jgi:hypothetical protein
LLQKFGKEKFDMGLIFTEASGSGSFRLLHYLLNNHDCFNIINIKDIDSLIFNFLWDNKPPKIKREVILQKANQGGLNITDIYTYSKSVKFQWVKKLLYSSFESSWKDIIKLRYHLFNQNFIFDCDLNTSEYL